MKYLKQLTAFLLAAILTTNLIGFKTQAAEPDKICETNITYVNPLYSNILTENDLQFHTPNSGVSLIDDTEEVEYLTSTKEAGSIMRDAMKARNETVTIHIATAEYNEDIVYNLLSEITSYAVMHTGIPTEGDYLAWQYGGWNASIGGYQYEDITLLDISFNIAYYTSAEQESEIDLKVNQVLNTLNLSGKSNYEKIYAIYEYICENIEYDYEHLGDEDYMLQYTAYAALVNETAVCQGYAVLLYRLALELDIDCRLIPGYGGGGPHAWNILQLGKYYYNADSTWDAGLSEYQYFLKSDQEFPDHERDVEYATEEFYELYPMGAESFTYDPTAPTITLMAPTISSVYSKVQTSAKVTWSEIENADGYELFRSTTPDVEGNWSLVKTITDKSTTQYTNQGLEIGTTYYYKIRAFAIDAIGNRIYSDFSDINYMPASVVFENVYSNSTSRLRLLWNEISGAHGYQIWCKDNDGSWKIVKTLGDKGNELTNNQGATTAYSNTGLTAGETYTYKMRAFAIIDGRKVFGAYSDEYSSAVKPETPTVTITSNKPGRAELNWDTVYGAAGYQIWMSTSENGNYSIVKSITDGTVISYTKYDLDSNETYYFKIRAYSEADNHKSFSDYSDICSITIQ